MNLHWLHKPFWKIFFRGLLISQKLKQPSYLTHILQIYLDCLILAWCWKIQFLPHVGLSTWLIQFTYFLLTFEGVQIAGLVQQSNFQMAQVGEMSATFEVTVHAGFSVWLNFCLSVWCCPWSLTKALLIFCESTQKTAAFGEPV